MSRSPPHILVVDDDPSIRELMAEYLAENDLRVTTATNGVEMTRALQECVIDLVMLDLRLSGEDGMQLARQLRESSEVPVMRSTFRSSACAARSRTTPGRRSSSAPNGARAICSTHRSRC